MKKIIINGRFCSQRITGVQRYAREILIELDKIIEPGEIEIAIPPDVVEMPSYNRIEVRKIGTLHHQMWEQFSFPQYVRREAGISLNLCNTAPLISPGIVAIFDMKIREYPEFFSREFVLWYRVLFANEVRRSKFIITDSLSAKHDILRYYNAVENKIIISYCGWEHYQRIQFDENALEKYGLSQKKYFFGLGSFDPNKNFKWIAEVAKANPEQIFAIAGSINRNVFADGVGFDCPKNMKLLGYVSDEEAKTLMRDCKAFLFPSFCEGFGIPPLEALSAGCRSLVVSDIPVMREVFGEKVNYIDPYIAKMNVNDLVQISSVEADKILEQYTWSKAAKRILEEIKRIH